MSIIVKYTILLYFFFIHLSLSCQDIEKDLDSEINTLRTKEHSAFNEKLLLKYNNLTLLDSLKKYDNDTLVTIRFNVLILEYKIATLNPQDTVIRQEVVCRLIRKINDPENLVKQNALKKLLTFSYTDFNKKSIDTLNKIIGENTLNKDLILLIGVANIKEQKQLLLSGINKNPVKSTSDFNSSNWAKHLALARMGNVESANYCIKNVESCVDTIVKITLLLYDVGYIRNETALVYLKKYLYDENRLPQVKNTVKGTQYCQYALDVIAGILINFPVKAKGMGYSEDEITIAREWIENNTEYKFKR